jgi:ATP-dependent Clp protease adaptor protein ClpS
MDSNVSILEKQKIKVRKPKQYKVIMHNDDFTTMEFVIDVLMNIFNKKFEEANKIMIDVHKKGKGIAGIYSYDIAVTKSSVAMALAKEEGFPFKLSVEEV